ncbi:EAL domain-containing protein [Novosphingobium sp. 1Y9A]|uniref:EAL domain-containing protein n=2 Tax=Novosphingobium jiangmenense TaxID=2791981 RepID=A0ABS0HKS4_9SPHN|nr:EAL domain-containing protein [Novosphingobium jiangmenense]
MAVKGIFRGLMRQGSAPQGDSASVAAPYAAPHEASVDPGLRLSLLESFEQTGLGWFWSTDSEGRLSYISQTVLEDAASFLGRPFVTVVETDGSAEVGQSARSLGFQLSARSRIADVVVRFAVRRDDPRWWSLSGQPRHTPEGVFEGYTGFARDVTREYTRQREDERAAEFDSLTGLYNRHRMTRRLDSVLSAYRASGRCCSLLMLDLDRFKHVNDTMGHPAGDELLRQVAERLRKVVGDRGDIGRLGGDEFQVILPDVEDRGKLGELTSRLIQMISQPYAIEGKRAVIGTSVGIAVAPHDGEDRDALVASADLALYAAKNGGRGQFRFFSAELKDEAQERTILTGDLREALGRGELELHYQPVVRIADNYVVGFEALMRWNHPERGAIAPSVFIPIAEESNLIVPLGDWALKQACSDAANWPDNVRLSVNVSAVQFGVAGFVNSVASALATSGIDPERLELELTETVFMRDSEAVDETFGSLKGLGVRLALDDFGTGYSSLSYLRSAPFDKLKIDRSFVETCAAKDNNSAKIISAVIGLADALGMETTVEGVEAFDQLEVVKKRGAKLVQGHLFARAMPLAEVETRLASGDLKLEPNGPKRHRPERRSVFRRVTVIHEDHRYEAVMRDLSRTGARIDGLLGVPVGTSLVVDLGGGQLVVSMVVRSEEAVIGVEFEQPLTSDGAGGLCTRHRVPPSTLAAAAAAAEPKGKPRFIQVAVPGSRDRA